jgi:hypothetical protein
MEIRHFKFLNVDHQSMNVIARPNFIAFYREWFAAEGWYLGRITDYSTRDETFKELWFHRSVPLPGYKRVVTPNNCAYFPPEDECVDEDCVVNPEPPCRNRGWL